MSFAVGCVKPIEFNVTRDPTALDSILLALKSTSKGKLQYPEPHIDPFEAEICDAKYVGDLDRIIGDREFDNETSFFDTFKQEETSIFFQDEDQAFKSEQLDFQSGALEYRNTATSPLPSPPGSPQENLPLFDDTSYEETKNDSSSSEPLCNIENFLARMQIDNDKSAAAIADRVKRYQDAYVAHVASIHASAVSELLRCEEQLKREEEEMQLKIIREQQQIFHTIEEEANILIANKASEAEKRKAEVLGQIAQIEELEEIQLQKELQSKDLIEKERRDDLMSILKESYNQFSTALDQMVREIREHSGELNLPPETDEELNKTLQQGDEVLKSEATIDDLETTVQKLHNGMTVVTHIRSIIHDQRKQASSESPVADQKESTITVQPEDSVESSDSPSIEVASITTSLSHFNPSAIKIIDAAKENFSKFGEIQRSVSNIANLLTSQDNNMRSKLSRVLMIVNQFSHDSSSNRQKLHQLINLLTGSMCNAGGVQVCVDDPNGPAAMFVKQQLSIKLVSLAHDKQVQNQAVYASLMLRLWQIDPILKHMCLHRLFLICPYLVPYVPARTDYATNEDYFKALGFRSKEDGTIEKLSSYLKRMSAIGQLYGRLVSVEVELPTFGLGIGWEWLSKLFLVPAQSAVTCAVLQGFLSMAGNLCIKTYGQQFHKLMRHLIEEFYPILEAVTVEGGGADLGSLRMLLDSYAKSGNIPPPTEGYRPLV